MAFPKSNHLSLARLNPIKVKTTLGIFLMFWTVCVAFANPPVLSEADIRDATVQFRKLAGLAADFYTYIPSKSGCDFSPCLPGTRHVTFERTVDETAPVVHYSGIQCRIGMGDVGASKWHCIPFDAGISVPSLYSNRISIEIDSKNGKTGISDDTILEMLRYLLSTCYDEQKVAYDASHPEPQSLSEKISKFERIGLTGEKGVFTLTGPSDGPSYNKILLKRIENRPECPFEIVGSVFLIE